MFIVLCIYAYVYTNMHTTPNYILTHAMYKHTNIYTYIIYTYVIYR